LSVWGGAFLLSSDAELAGDELAVMKICLKATALNYCKQAHQDLLLHQHPTDCPTAASPSATQVVVKSFRCVVAA
jgi:hypothetical protein